MSPVARVVAATLALLSCAVGTAGDDAASGAQPQRATNAAAAAVCACCGGAVEPAPR